MIETISNLSGISKVSALPLFLLTAVNSVKVIIKEDKRPGIDNAVPGDNFPYIVMSWGI